MKVFDKTIETLVDENYIYARALDCLGIDFYQCPNRKLGEICEQRGLKQSQVIKSFYLFDQMNRFSLIELEKYPLDILIQYLRHSHHLFIKDKLPYISKLILNHPAQEDLKLIFPVFVEDFIQHIYEEEDTLFGYIQRLLKVESGKQRNPAAFLWPYRQFSLCKAHLEHEDEDELEGIRNLVASVDSDDIHWKVIREEIKAFDREMFYHAEIENKIFFPKALKLEREVRQKVKDLVSLN